MQIHGTKKILFKKEWDKFYNWYISNGNEFISEEKVGFYIFIDKKTKTRVWYRYVLNKKEYCGIYKKWYDEFEEEVLDKEFEEDLEEFF